MATEVPVADPSQVYDLSPTQTFRVVYGFFFFKEISSMLCEADSSGPLVSKMKLLKVKFSL
jgi:hypothetical protein